ncbi:polyphosphate polymerase domain-containing protein [bacterium]|nr:polyphosphate polymerase domain-containing protein [bacterium]
MSDALNDIRRYELKYTVTESTASQIKDYISNICILDKHVPEGESGYTVNNLYFDTADLRFYQDTKFRKLTRYKPRARFYGMKIGSRIWPEIKYRHGSIIWKERTCIPVDCWPGLFYPELSDEKSRCVKQRLSRFEELIHWHDAQPVLHVRYFREPYVTQLESYGRITFDYSLAYREIHGSIDLEYPEKDMVYFDDPVTTVHYESPVILEIKVETLVPQWTIHMIKKFNLVQRPFSKYCYGIDFIKQYMPCGRNAVCQAAPY